MNDNEVRLIDANALIEDLKSLKYIGYCNDGFSILGNREIERCISAVEDAPTADDWENYSTKLWKEAYEQGKADRPQGMSDLISREELKKHKFLTPDYIQLGGRRNGKTIERINLAYQKGWNDAIDAIYDNAQTVEITEEQAIDKLHETGWMQKHDKEMTVQPKGEWIPVSERLPEEYQNTLVTIQVSDREPKVRSGWYACGLFQNDNGDVWKVTDPEVKAWQPLPEPYRKGGKE